MECSHYSASSSRWIQSCSIYLLLCFEIRIQSIDTKSLHPPAYTGTSEAPLHLQEACVWFQDKRRYVLSDLKMSQPSFPRTFTFVGGPSRKRRREAAPNHTTRAVSTTKHGKRNDQTTSVILTGSDIGLRREDNDNEVTSGIVISNDHAASPSSSETPPAYNSPDDSQPHPLGGLESLQGWQLPSPTPVIPEGLESTFEFGNAFHLSSHQFHMPSLPLLSFPDVTVPESSMGSSEESFQEEENLPSLDDAPLEGPLDLVEDISRIRPIVININDKFLKIFAQCKISISWCSAL